MVLDTNNANHLAWLKNMHAFHKCPRCEKGQLDTRVKRSFLVKYVFVWMDVKRYECNNCHKKSYIKREPEV